MKRLSGLATLVAIVALALMAATQAVAAGPTTVTNTYSVSGGSVPGASTGLVLTSGMSVTVTAAGAVCPFGDSFCPGPNGYAPWNTTTSGYGGFVLPGAPAWGLVGRVGSLRLRREACCGGRHKQRGDRASGLPHLLGLSVAYKTRQGPR